MRCLSSTVYDVIVCATFDEYVNVLALEQMCTQVVDTRKNKVIATWTSDLKPCDNFSVVSTTQLIYIQP